MSLTRSLISSGIDLGHLDRGLLDVAAEAQHLAALRRLLHHLWAGRGSRGLTSLTLRGTHAGGRVGFPLAVTAGVHSAGQARWQGRCRRTRGQGARGRAKRGDTGAGWTGWEGAHRARLGGQPGPAPKDWRPSGRRVGGSEQCVKPRRGQSRHSHRLSGLNPRNPCPWGTKEDRAPSASRGSGAAELTCTRFGPPG